MRNLIDNNSGNDEFYTPLVFVKPIVEFIPKGSVIWCPFDLPNSEFVLFFKECGFTVISSHIVEGKDFFNYLPDENFDFIISNPPFSKKYLCLERAKQIGKPFAFVMPNTFLSDASVYRIFDNFQLLLFDKRISFNGLVPTFGCCYLCKDFLPKDLIFRNLENSNIGKDFVPSRMDSVSEQLNLFDFQERSDGQI